MRRTPVELKEILGTKNVTKERRKQEIRYDPERNKEVTMPPDYFGEKAKNLWVSNVAQMASVAMNFPSVYEYMESYCRAYELRESAWIEMMHGEGVYVMEGETETKPGVRRMSQSYRVYNEQVEKMVLIGAKLGFTPVDKTRISALIIDTEKDKNGQKRIGAIG